LKQINIVVEVDCVVVVCLWCFGVDEINIESWL
jgi:hypothetical protein